MSSKVKLYADDTKLIASAKNIHDHQQLQADLDKKTEWTSKWLVQLNLDKFKIMHMGLHNQAFDYTLNNNNNELSFSIQSTTCEKDLGIMIESDLKWHNQVKQVYSKANRIIGMLSRTFSYLNERMVSQL